MDNMQDNHHAKIGKDVIESLTDGMYTNCRYIYREYIQNSVDQIDKAVETKILSNKSQGCVYINIDKPSRKIIIEDNATGIESDNALNILKNVAKSQKDRSKDRGFRGIGRLAGLAYCDSLIFETSYKSENVKCVFKWDAKKLRDIINNRNTSEDASFVLDAITTFEQYQEEPEEHYFKVILDNVSNDILLDKSDIRNYLSMVAPIPFNNVNFRLSKKIYDFVSENNYKLDEYSIYVNNEKIYKAYTNYLYEGNEGNKKKYDEISDIEVFKINDNENTMAWGWYGISTFNGFIPAINISRGIRLRKGNIQIGQENCLEDFHKEKRGNSYFIGEIHAIDPDLIPNSQRDFFIGDDSFKKFDYKLREIFSNNLYHIYHSASNYRSHVNNIRKMLELKKEFDDKEKKGYINKDERNKILEKFNDNKEKALKSKEKLIKIAENLKNGSSYKKNIFNTVIKKETEEMSEIFAGKNPQIEKIVKIIPNIVTAPIKEKSDISSKVITDNLYKLEDILIDENNHKPVLLADKHKNLNKEQRKMLAKIFATIEEVLNEALAKNLIEKISEKLK